MARKRDVKTKSRVKAPTKPLTVQKTKVRRLTSQELAAVAGGTAIYTKT
jgi:hypothetical protein